MPPKSALPLATARKGIDSAGCFNWTGILAYYRLKYIRPSRYRLAKDIARFTIFAIQAYSSFTKSETQYEYVKSCNECHLFKLTRLIDWLLNGASTHQSN